jgi:uncharacterized integral membrane protein
MRWFHLTVIVLFVLAMVIFVFQNFQTVTMSFLGITARVPMAMLVVVIYLLGMATGGSLISLLRWAYQGSRRA